MGNDAWLAFVSGCSVYARGQCYEHHGYYYGGNYSDPHTFRDLHEEMPEMPDAPAFAPVPEAAFPPFSDAPSWASERPGVPEKILPSFPVSEISEISEMPGMPEISEIPEIPAAAGKTDAAGAMDTPDCSADAFALQPARFSAAIRTSRSKYSPISPE